MPAFSSTAPGKVILVGEHAVVYGRPAIAVPVSQVAARAEVRADPRGPSGRVWIQAPGVNVDSDLVDLPPQDPLAATVNGLLAALGVDRVPSLLVRVTSTIPIASGLGSGAAVSVAMIRALAGFLGRPLPDETVSALAFEVEKLHHGTPSGIDNTVITYGQPVFYRQGKPLQTLQVGAPLTLVVADTGQPSPTAVTVGVVRRGWHGDPDRYEGLFDQIGDIALRARHAMERGDAALLGTQLDANQERLAELGLSSPALDRLVMAARKAGSLGAKLSGGGQGGNMIALSPPGRAEVISRCLTDAGAVRTIVTHIPETRS